MPVSFHFKTAFWHMLYAEGFYKLSGFGKFEKQNYSKFLFYYSDIFA